MSVAENLVGRELPGKNRPGTWRVTAPVPPHPESEGGTMSIAYVVEDDDGNEAFLKATDLHIATRGDNLLDRLHAVTEHHMFERKILERCHGNNMDRIVTPIDFGEQVVTDNGTNELLFWIVFELAECDARVQISRLAHFNFHWTVTALHNLTTAIAQLHNADVTHNDARPSNVLVYSDVLQKLSDLGCAYCSDIAAMHDGKPCVGDHRLAPPEVLYADDSYLQGSPTDLLLKRRAGDLYLLGSLGYYFVTGNMLTPAVFARMASEHRPAGEDGQWQGTFAGVLPYFRFAYSSAMDELKTVLPTDENGDLTGPAERFFEAIMYLTEPDPENRGHPQNRQGFHDQYAMDRFISRFNSLKSRTLN